MKTTDTNQSYPPHVNRMIEEMEQLGPRVTALENFLADDDKLADLPYREVQDLKMQHHHMDCYRIVLARRILNATKGA